MEKEFWRNIPRYANLYQASTHGRIRRHPRMVENNGTLCIRKGGIVSQSRTSKGYCRVKLYYEGKGREELVHRLVAETFIPNKKKLPCINHKDENKTNNHVENLEWCTYKYNNLYGTRIQKSVSKQSKPVIKDDGCSTTTYPSMQEAARQTGVSAGHICQVCNGKRNKAGGFVWRFLYK